MKDKESQMEHERENSSEVKDNTVKLLTDEIQRLKMIIDKITENMAWGNSVVKVIFRDEFYEEKYKSKMESFLKEILHKDENFILNSQIYDRGEQEFSRLQTTLQAEKNKSSSSKNKTSNFIPLYSSAYEDILQREGPESDEENVDEKIQTLTCFNCLGDHHMKQCPEKIDFSKVSANKKEILMENSVRYHIEEKKNTVKPGGLLSSEMRKAMGLKEEQLPPYIYRMRIIGYPPGWMDDALFETSGLSLYDEDGKAITDDESAKASESGKKYDSSRFIEYPGFNCPVPPQFKDEWQNFGMVPIQPHQQLSEAIKADDTVNSNHLYKRKNVATTDEAEETKKVKNGTNDANDSLTHWSPENCSTPKTKESHSTKMTNGSPVKKGLGNSISQCAGTPILPQGNQFDKLPQFDKFAQGITEHLPFENLPDSVGKFEKMRDVLSDVQKKLQTLKKGS